MTTAAIAQFMDAIRVRGLLPKELVADGTLQRCPVAGGKSGRKDGSYILHLDRIPAGGFENHRDGLGWENWRADVPANHVPQDREQFRQQMEADRQASETDRRARQEEAARRAAQLWALSRPATGDHPYLLAKGVAAYGLHRLGERLVVPVRDSAGKLWSLQFIGPDGQKRFLTAGRKGGCYYAIGRVGAVICVAEGYATGASIFAATGYAVAVAFDAGNLEPVARALRAKYPGQRLVICADNDIHTPGNPGIARATAAAMAVNALLAVPEFGEVSA